MSDIGEPSAGGAEQTGGQRSTGQPEQGHGGHRRLPAGFLFAGRAVFTLVGRHRRYTYRVSRVPDHPQYPAPAYSVGMLVGPDQWSYIGLLVDPYTTLRLTQASQLTAGALPVKALEWALPYLTTGKSLPEPAEVWHEGRCGRCGRALTDPESIARGLGPECWEILGGGV